MNSESGYSLPVSVESSEEIRDYDEVHNNGCFDVENRDYDEVLSGVNEEGSDDPSKVKSESSPNQTMKKGYGLKKWRRIKRDVSKAGESSVDASKMVVEDLPSPAVHQSKRAQVYAEKGQKSEGSVSSVSSRNPVVGNLVMGSTFDVGKDLESSEDHSSVSSTAVSIPQMKYDVPVVLGFPHDKHMMRNLGGKKLAQKGKIETIKKAREEQIKKQGAYARSNGIGGQKPVHDGENGDEVEGADSLVGRRDYGRENGGYHSPQDVIADSSLEFKDEKSEKHASSSDQDPLVESIFVLQAAQEALEKEVLKIKEISKDISVDDLVSDTQPDIMESFEQFSAGGELQKVSLVEIAKREAERELEDLFKQKIEAEVEYFAISRAVRKLMVPSVDQSTSLKQHMKPVSDQNKILRKYGDKVRSNEALKLQKKVCKYALYFFVQVLSLLIILGVLRFQSSPNYVGFVPT